MAVLPIVLGALLCLSGPTGPLQESGKTPYALVDGQRVPVPAIAMGEPEVIARILEEGKKRNRVMEHLTVLSTEMAPRLTGSSQLDKANRWSMQQFRSWGLESSLHEWGEIPVGFERGPSRARVGSIREVEGRAEFRAQRECEFTALAWSAGTRGPVLARICKLPASESELEATRDAITGSWVLVGVGNGRHGVINGMFARQKAFAQIRGRSAASDKGGLGAPPPRVADDGVSGEWTGAATGGPLKGDVPFVLELSLNGRSLTGRFGSPLYGMKPIVDAAIDDASRGRFQWEGPGGVQTYTFRISGETISGKSEQDGGAIVFSGGRSKPTGDVQSLEERVLALRPAGWISSSGDDLVRTTCIDNWRELKPNEFPSDPEVQVRRSDYDWINSRLADGAEVYAEIDLPHRFVPGPIPVHNTIAEIRGSTWPDEVVIVSAHLDSWDGPGSQGATDNGTGAAVTLEAARILAAARARPKRTIRFILWTGEEQGLLGSREYVETLRDRGELDRISAVFVDDGGTNYEGGLKCTPAMEAMLAAATAPINGQFFDSTDQKYLDVNIRPVLTGLDRKGNSSDHASFLAAGVPAFFWDESGRADYGFGWHTQNDRLELAIPLYLEQSATCAAVTAYNLACAPALLPRPQNEEK